MEIKLYYIEGISEEDTPFFLTETEQVTYFGNHLVKRIESTWYPPYFTNRIKTDLVSFRDNVNYLSFEYQGKVYYYFITSADYIAEELIELAIKMDTIQTYMFNISLKGAVVERKFIDRWKENGTINRNYIRENVSVCDKHLVDYRYYKGTELSGSNDYTTWCYVFKSGTKNNRSTKLKTRVSAVGYGDFTTNTGAHINTGNQLMILPLPANYTHEMTMTDGGSSPKTANIDQALQTAMHDADIQQAYVFPYNPFDTNDLKVSLLVGNYSIRYDSSKVELVPETESTKNDFLLIYKDTSTIVPALRYKNYDLGFSKNTMLQTAFTTKMCPALIDENYLMLTWGENGGVSQYPMWHATSSNFYLYYWGDVTTGSRFYTITSYSAGTLETYKALNEWGQVGAINMPITIDLVNDPWNQWKYANRASIGMQYVGLALQCIGGATQTSGAMKGQSWSNASPIVDVEQGKFGKSAKSVSMYGSESTSTSKTKSTGSSGGMLGLATEQYNSWLAPTTTRIMGSFASDVASGSINIGYKLYQVDDLDNCAMFYHKYGYKVMKPYKNEIPYFYNEFRSRVYYNYVKMFDCEVHLDTLETEELCSEIRDRFINGIRLWETQRRVHNGVLVTPITMTNYAIDNVEINYIGG